MIEQAYLANDLIAHISASEWLLLEPHATVVTLRHAQILFSDDEPAQVTYFPLTCIISMIAVMENGDECEYGCIGREGMLGLQLALEAQPLRGMAICQLAGQALRCNSDVLRTVTASSQAPDLHRLLLRYAQATINVLAQSAACNALHAVPERTARWLLQTCDRASSNNFSLTQDFLAKMLGVRRATVTETALGLQDRGIIEYSRGHISVLDRPALEAASCECYRIMRDEYARVFQAAAY
jgi:CRP-like cAMP-binding protein